MERRMADLGTEVLRLESLNQELEREVVSYSEQLSSMHRGAGTPNSANKASKKRSLMSRGLLHTSTAGDDDGEVQDMEGGFGGEDTFVEEEERSDGDDKKDFFAGAHFTIRLYWRCLQSYTPAFVRPHHLFNIIHLYWLILQVAMVYMMFLPSCAPKLD